LGTGFTYHGRLQQSGQPLNGAADLEFALYDADIAGNLLGSQTLSGVSFADGLFSVLLNAGGELGANAFNGDKRWLEVSVNGTALVPRQALTATPFALKALSPSGYSLDAADGDPANVVSVSNSGLVGVHTLSPQATLHVAARTITAFRADSIATAFTDTAIMGVSEDTAGRFETSGSYGRAVHATATSVGPNAYAGYFEGQVYTNGFLYRGYTASSRSAAIPLAYGVVNANGTIASGTGNFTVTVQTEGFGQSFYVIAVTGESLPGSGCTAIITPYGITGSTNTVPSWAFGGGAMQVRLRTVGQSSPIAQTFSFVLFASAPGKDGGNASVDATQTSSAQSPLQDPSPRTVCSGSAVTDQRGYATIALPERFDEGADSFRYQLTVVDDGEREDFVRVKVVRKVTGNRFTIRTSSPFVEVSWHVEHGS
jgi:hypothetical protein